MGNRYFPIKVEPACPLKWNWSTLYIDREISASCHRTAFYPLTVENFDNFHNNPKVVEERKQMLSGQWPADSCEYCRHIEERGGFSDRMWHSETPDQVPRELQEDPTAVIVTPTIVEVFFDSLCNMACIYCPPSVTSTLNAEYTKFGPFKKNGVELIPYVVNRDKTDQLTEKMFLWMQNNLRSIRRFQLLGGEPLLQPEFFRTLDLLETMPCPDLEFEIITNLKHDHLKFKKIIERIRSLAIKRCFKRIDIICSIDGWGDPLEYVRYGINVSQWEQNFKYLLENKWITSSINTTVSSLTLKTLPILLEKMADWKKIKHFGHTISGVAPKPTWLMVNIFGPGLFDDDFKKVISLLPTNRESEKRTIEYMRGLEKIASEERKENEIIKLHTFLEEKDRRRGTNWKRVFPWLITEFEKCGIVV